MQVDKNVIKYAIRNKNININDNKLYRELLVTIKNLEEEIHKKDNYEKALFIQSNEYELKRKSNIIIHQYKIGEILLADLGVSHYKGEFAYIHPVIVISQTNTKLFIVPCSSGDIPKDKKGNMLKECLKCGENEGLDKDCHVKLYDARYISKARIINSFGNVTKEFFDILYNNLFEQLFESKFYELKKIKFK